MDKPRYHGGENAPNLIYIEFKFFVDGATAPVNPGNPLNFYITSFTRVSQGIFRLTLADTYKLHVDTAATMNVAAGGVQRWAQAGPVANFGTALPATVDILIVDNANAVQDPPAGASVNNFISGTIICCDSGQV